MSEGKGLGIRVHLENVVRALKLDERTFRKRYVTKYGNKGSREPTELL